MPTISDGNSKLGSIPNINLPPIKACRADFGDRHPPCAPTCYALKAWRMYPETRAAWNGNLEQAQRDLAGYFADISKWLLARRSPPPFFRWHSAGDILSEGYLLGIVEMARLHRSTRFLCFTKQHAIVARFWGRIPGNLSLVLSAWPGLPVHNPRGLPVAYMRPREGTEPRLTGCEVKCPGDCRECKACWSLARTGRNVVFDQH